MRRLLGFGIVLLAAVLLTPLSAFAATTAARIANCPPAFGCFSPNPIQISAGDSVTWTNNTAIAHTATSDSGVWDTGAIAPGTTSAAVAFPTAGTFPYHCAIHSSMTGTVIVSAASATPAPTSPPVRGLASGGGGPALPIAAALLLSGFGLLALANRRRHRSQRI